MTRLTLSALILSLLAPAVMAGEQCGPRAEAVRQLEENFNERAVMVGIASNGNLIEVYATPDGRTFTFLYTTPLGLSCVSGTGEDLSIRKIVVAEPAA